MNAKEELQKKLSGWEARIGMLAYQKIQIEKDIATLEAAISSGKAVLADMTTEEAIKQAQTNKEVNNNV